jgi:type VI secretion system protein ImpI
MAFNPHEPATEQQSTMVLGGGAQIQQQIQQYQQQAAQGVPRDRIPTGLGLPGGVDMQQLVQITEQTKPYYDQYRHAWSQTLQQLRAHLERVPGPQREGLVLCLCQQFPQLANEPEFRQLLDSLGVSSTAVGEVDPAEFIKRLGGHTQLPPGAQVNTALAMERVGAILESYSQAFVELRKGYEQFGEEMALQLVQERNPLHDAQTGQDVLRYLLDWTTDSGERVRELTRAFADLALHQVALLSGVMEGVRSMLHSISPTTLSGERSHALAKQGGGGLVEKVFNFRKAGLWTRFSDAHQKLIEEDRFSREVFGRNFARAYFMVTGGLLQGDDGGAGAHSDPNQSAVRPQYGHPQTRPYNH